MGHPISSKIETRSFDQHSGRDPGTRVRCEDLCDELAEMESLIDVQTDEGCPTGNKWCRLENVFLKPGWPILKHVFLHIIFVELLTGPIHWFIAIFS